MSWLQKILPPKINRVIGPSKKNVPEGLWSKCPKCDSVLYRTDLEANAEVCPKCDYHNRISARDRLNILLDEEGRIEIGGEVQPIDPLKFKDTKRYADRIKASQSEVGETDALLVIQGSIKQVPVVAASFEFKFMGGSMGSVVGERFVRGVQAAIDSKSAFICVSASGGARMQEGLFSLMQMAKTSAKLTLMAEAGLPYISLCTDPTTGGVTASYAMLGDFNIAEPKAMIGFAGPRVIKETIKKDLPEGFQTSEFLLETGFLDFIVNRKQLKSQLAKLLAMFR